LSNDKHLGIIYDPDWVSQIRAQGQEEDVYMTEEMIAEERSRNFGFKRVEILDGNVGFLDLRIFFHSKYAGKTAAAAMDYLSNCDAIIVDLRNNGGGWGDMVAFMCSYFFDGEDLVLLMTGYSRPEEKYYQSWTIPYIPGKHMDDVPLFILTSKSTFSAAEEFCYDLKYLKRATIVGETTRGGAHPIDLKVLDDNLLLQIPEWRSIHPVTKTNWEGVGVEPDIAIPADEALDVAYLKALEELRKTAPNSDAKALYQWYIDGHKAKMEPAVVDTETLARYVGKYGAYNITLDDVVLLYQRGDRAKYRMTPMSEVLFVIDEVSDRRLKFVVEDGRVTGLVALYNDGERVEYPKEDD
jgi:C-terminal processing protease CtpA/Prc